MTAPVLHVVFNPSAAASLRDALRMAGRDDRVVALFHSLSFGPINPPDAAIRAKWVEDELGYDWDDVTARSEPFWRDALSPDCQRVVWMTRRSANEYAGFLEYVWRLGDMACDVIDMTDVMISRQPQHGPPTPPFLAVSLAGLFPDEIADNKFWDLANELGPAAEDGHVDLCRQLRAENAPLRIIKDGTLASASIKFFDSILLSFVTNDWQKTARVVGQALVVEMEDCIYQTGDLVLAARIRSLAEAGVIESRGDLANIRASEVRLPS